MAKKIGKKKSIKGVDTTKATKNVDEASAISEIGGIKALSGVGKVAKSGVIQRSQITQNISASERDKLFRMINEETDKLCNDGTISPKSREVVENAVKMVVDAAIIDDEEDS